MNESDRAAFASAEEDLMALNCDPEELEKIEDLWVAGERRTAAQRLTNATGSQYDDCFDVLRRNYP